MSETKSRNAASDTLVGKSDYDPNWDVTGYQKLLTVKRAFDGLSSRFHAKPPTVRMCNEHLLKLINEHTQAVEATIKQFKDKANPDFDKALKDLIEGCAKMNQGMWDLD